MRSFRYVLADVFTDAPLAGNQLAVFTDARDLDELTMQALALELGLSETVFVLPPREGGTVRIRIFTPQNELLFAGHPCLGTAFVLGAPLQLGTIALETGNGIVPVELERDPSRADRLRPDDAAGADRRAVRARGRAAGGARRRVARSCRSRSTTTASGTRMSCSPSKEDVAALRPGHERADGARPRRRARARQATGTDWKMRMFSPLDGVGEDAATGSAAGPLACHLGRHGVVPWGDEIEIEQGTEIGRPSTLYARASGSGDTIETVEVGGLRGHGRPRRVQGALSLVRPAAGGCP